MRASTLCSSTGRSIAVAICCAIIVLVIVIPTFGQQPACLATGHDGSSFHLYDSNPTDLLARPVHQPVQMAQGGSRCPSVLSFSFSRFRNGAGLALPNLSRAGIINRRVGALAWGTSNAMFKGVNFDNITNDMWLATTGNWSVGTNWSMGVPTSGNNVLITNSGSVVTENINGSINNLTLNLGNSLSLNNGINLSIGGNAISNAGQINLNSTGNGTGITITTGTVTLSGGGTITMGDSSNPNNYIYGQGSVETLVNTDNTIQGSGTIGDSDLTISNAGTIDANNADHGLTIQVNSSANPGVTNTGTLEATNGGMLTLNGSTYNNMNGTIEATGGGIVQLSNHVTIEGGKLTTDSGMNSMIEIVSGNQATLDGSTQGTLTNSGAFVVANGTANVKGTINNTGSIMLEGDGSSANLQLSGNTMLTGAGTVTLADSGNPQNYISGGYTLTNQETIQGSGQIGNGSAMSLINQGTIDANNADNLLEIRNTGGTTNTGTLEATNGGTLLLSGGTLNNGGGGTIKATGGSMVQLSSGNIQNMGGTIQATGGSMVQLSNNVTIQGGTLTTDSGMNSAIETMSGSNATLDGSTRGTLTNSGAFVVANNSTAYVKGTINNTGSIMLMGDGSNATLQLIGNTTLTGGGTVTLADSETPLNYISGGFTLTNSAQQTIQGSGEINTATLSNQGTIDANNADNPLEIRNTGGTTNTGTLEATNSATLVLYGETLNNDGGTIKATGGGMVQLQGVTVQGGKLTDSGTGSVIETVAGSTTALDGSTRGTLTNSGAFVVVNNSTADVEGTIDNTGSITLKGDGNNSYLSLIGNTTLMGGGIVTLAKSGTVRNYISGGYTLTNQETIQGSGQIGNGTAMSLSNQGTIDANNAGADNLLEIHNTGVTTNTGMLEATNRATLLLSGETLTNDHGGMITATGDGSKVQLYGGTIDNSGGTIQATGGSKVDLSNGVTIQGGTLTTDSGMGSVIETVVTSSGNYATLDAVTNAGNFVVADNTYANLKGTITNTGSITLKGDGYDTSLQLMANTTLTGGGTVTLADSRNPLNFINSSGNYTLTNRDNLIQGTGNIGDGHMGLINDGTILSNGSGLTVETSSAGLTNNGTLEVASGSSMHVSSAAGGTFTNFSNNTLTGGAYNVSGTLEIDQLGSSGGEILTNAANITLNGAHSSFLDKAGNNALSSLNTNAASGSFTISGGHNFTTMGNFTNKGAFDVGSGSTLTVGGTGTSFTQLSGTTTDDGTLAVSSSGSVSLQAGSLFGIGTVNGKVSSSGTVTPGNSSTTTGILTDSGAYTQNVHGVLDIGIGGTTVGSQYDRLESTTASLNGKLNISLLNGFVPALGSTFKIVTSNSDSGQFATVTGLAINSSEHFTIAYQSTDVLLTVVSGSLSSGVNNSSFNFSQSKTPAITPHPDSGLAGLVGSKPGLSAAQFGAGNASVPSPSFQAAAASLMGSSSANLQARFGLLQTAPTATSGFAAMPSNNAGHGTTSELRFPTRLAPNSIHNNGAYGLHSRAMGAGLAFPLMHLSKPQMGLLVE